MPDITLSRCDYCGSRAFALITASIAAPASEQPCACRRCLPRAAAVIGQPSLQLAPAPWALVGGAR